MRFASRLATGVGVLALLALLTFALPIEEWRTGELRALPLPIVEGGPAVDLPPRVWIDTDAACGIARTTDPDDCFAILLLARARDVQIVGISTVQGNASLSETDSVTRELVGALRSEGQRAPPVQQGPASVSALHRALEAGPLTLIALGPLTNLATALAARPDLRANVGRLVAVMGRRPGHLFHPAEGVGKGGILFGHGPVFSDFNYEQDRAAATAVIAMGLPTTLIPYEAARQIRFTAADLARLERRGGAAAWVAQRARGWLDYWTDDVGLAAFYPFDLLAAAYVLNRDRFGCAEARMHVGRDFRLWGRFWGPWAVLVRPKGSGPATSRAAGPAVYCERVDPATHGWLLTELAPK